MIKPKEITATIIPIAMKKNWPPLVGLLRTKEIALPSVANIIITITFNTSDEILIYSFSLSFSSSAKIERVKICKINNPVF